jgi:Cd2+/Zn2+-exporting ATPase
VCEAATRQFDGAVRRSLSDNVTTPDDAIALNRRRRRTIAVLVTSALTIGIPSPLGVVGYEGSTIVVPNGLRLLRSPVE